MGIISGAILTLICLVCLDNIAMFLGANSENINLVKEYMRIIMIMPIGFILNPMLSIFIRNDKAPQLAMWSMILSSLSNIILDYILVFPLGMGMKGAALATFVSPIVAVSYTHLVFAYVIKQYIFYNKIIKFESLTLP